MDGRLNKERREYKLEDGSTVDELLNLLSDRIRIEQERIESIQTNEIDYKQGSLSGRLNGMMQVLAWISALEKGRSI